MEAIVAVYSDWGIGRNGTQPVVLKADRAHFRNLTAGAAVIVGRRTLGDFPGGKPLKGRYNIVVTSSVEPVSTGSFSLGSIPFISRRSILRQSQTAISQIWMNLKAGNAKPEDGRRKTD